MKKAVKIPTAKSVGSKVKVTGKGKIVNMKAISKKKPIKVKIKKAKKK